MRLIYTLLIALIFVSCSKSDQVAIGNVTPDTYHATEVVNASVVAGGEYQMQVTSTNMKIYRQPSYFEVSSIEPDAKTGLTVYRYVPAKGFTGTDEVTLTDTKKTHDDAEGGECHNGSGMGTATTFVKIKFTVTN